MEQAIITTLNEHNVQTTFREIVGTNASKSDVVTNFLELLEMAQKKEVRCAQVGDEIHVYDAR